MSKHTLSVLVENKPGVLARIAGLFSRRGFNIDSLAVGPTEHAEILSSWFRRLFPTWVPDGVDHALYVQTATSLAMRKRQAVEAGVQVSGTAGPNHRRRSCA